MTLGSDPVIAWDGETAVLGFDLHDTNLPLKYDFPVLIQNILYLLLAKTESAEAETEEIVPREESDVRFVAPDAAAEAGALSAARGQDLTGILLGVFLALLTAEFVLAREPWVRRNGKEAKQ